MFTNPCSEDKKQFLNGVLKGFQKGVLLNDSSPYETGHFNCMVSNFKVLLHTDLEDTSYFFL